MIRRTEDVDHLLGGIRHMKPPKKKPRPVIPMAGASGKAFPAKKARSRCQ